MDPTRARQFEKDFNATYGPNAWKEFCQDVWNKVRPQAVQEKYKSKSGGPMSKSTYYKWEARAMEVKPREGIL